MSQTLAETLHFKIGDSLKEMIDVARKGVPMRTVESLGRELELSLRDLSTVLPVSYRSLKRYPKDHVLDKDLSAHVLELGRAFAQATDTLGDPARARRWLFSPSKALGGETPFSLLDTTPGVEAVLGELGRIE